MTLPNWTRSYLKPSSIEILLESVKSAEANTAGEIIPMIVRRSSTTGHVPVIILCLLALLFFIIDGPTLQSDYLGGHWAWYLGDIAILLIMSSALAKFFWIQRLLTSKSDQEDQVNMRAEIEFYESDIKNTKDGTGILLFVSLMEHRAVVLADDSINKAVSHETWNEVCILLIEGIKQKDMTLAFQNAIRRCGEILSPHFPIRPDDTNELKNHLIIKE